MKGLTLARDQALPKPTALDPRPKLLVYQKFVAPDVVKSAGLSSLSSLADLDALDDAPEDDLGDRRSRINRGRRRDDLGSYSSLSGELGIVKSVQGGGTVSLIRNGDRDEVDAWIFTVTAPDKQALLRAVSDPSSWMPEASLRALQELHLSDSVHMSLIRLLASDFPAPRNDAVEWFCVPSDLPPTSGWTFVPSPVASKSPAAQSGGGQHLKGRLARVGGADIVSSLEQALTPEAAASLLQMDVITDPSDPVLRFARAANEVSKAQPENSKAEPEYRKGSKGEPEYRQGSKAEPEYRQVVMGAVAGQAVPAFRPIAVYNRYGNVCYPRDCKGKATDMRFDCQWLVQVHPNHPKSNFIIDVFPVGCPASMVNDANDKDVILHRDMNVDTHAAEKKRKKKVQAEEEDPAEHDCNNCQAVYMLRRSVSSEGAVRVLPYVVYVTVHDVARGDRIHVSYGNFFWSSERLLPKHAYDDLWRALRWHQAQSFTENDGYVDVELVKTKVGVNGNDKDNDKDNDTGVKDTNTGQCLNEDDNVEARQDLYSDADQDYCSDDYYDDHYDDYSDYTDHTDTDDNDVDVDTKPIEAAIFFNELIYRLARESKDKWMQATALEIQRNTLDMAPELLSPLVISLRRGVGFMEAGLRRGFYAPDAASTQVAQENLVVWLGVSYDVRLHDESHQSSDQSSDQNSHNSHNYYYCCALERILRCLWERESPMYIYRGDAPLICCTGLHRLRGVFHDFPPEAFPGIVSEALKDVKEYLALLG
jgi:hypothetical protein